MKFWDTSAIIPLLIPEAKSSQSVQLIQKDPEMIVWSLTVTEVHSALHRKIRLGQLKAEDLSVLKGRLDIYQQSWTEIFQIEAVRARAIRLLNAHPLRAADSLQLAAALVVFEENPEGHEFVCFDDGLSDAARREGFITP